MMKTLKDLINKEEFGWGLVKSWMKDSKNNFEILPKNPKRADEELLRLQISTKSPVAAIVFETGGILIDHGWLRILGSGSNKLNRGIMEWNKGKTYSNEGEKGGFLLIADDVIGGYFAINAGELGEDIGQIYYFAPHTSSWESLSCGYSDFINWSLNGDLDLFYQAYKWESWKDDMANVNGSDVYSDWSAEGRTRHQSNNRKWVSTEERVKLALQAV
ncbi:DUF2625 family protein [Sphingobacterium faecium]|uniref:DUF2625 family protein n=1 Tax=Sphingobacterium faecium TaxID=34087 RepID=UPI001B882E9A|nr:DUF2625 family protein [Sphingobacterium faecium]